MTFAPAITERRHAGRGIVFELDGSPYYTATCCTLSLVEVTDQDRRQCVTTCPKHGRIKRQYDPAMTPAQKSDLDYRFFHTGGSDFNPPSDPDGERQQARRISGTTTTTWYAKRGK